ncbi:DNA primase subunit pri2 [Rhizina undulata]
MFRQDLKRRAVDHRKKHFGAAPFKETDYPHRLNFYNIPPTAEITLDQFEQWAIDRLRILGEIESCLYRNKTFEELSIILTPLLKKFLPLDANSSNSTLLQEERRKDHYSHFILRLAFARSEELRRRFSKAEAVLFRIRFTKGDARELQTFVESLNFDWEPVSEDEKQSLAEPLLAATGTKILDTDSFFKVDWERVSDLVESRKVFVKWGKAYVPTPLQLSLVLAEFTSRLVKALELTARMLPRLDEDDRLIPILNHLSLGFQAPEYNPSITPGSLNGEALTAASIDGLVQHFPMCMRYLHTILRREKHLKHHSRQQYYLFLKGVGLSVEESLIFWRAAFSNHSDDEFKKKGYSYNIRHSYGLEGTRRNYKPLSCQQIIYEHKPNSDDVHGCPFKQFSPDNLNSALSSVMGVTDRDVLGEVRTDVEAKKYHIACNKVFEHFHEKELKREKAAGNGVKNSITLIHPNEYFERSFALKNPGAMTNHNGNQGSQMDVEVEPMM